MQIKLEQKEKYDKYVEINSKDPYSKACVDSADVFGTSVDEGRTFDEAQRIMHDKEGGLTGNMMGEIMQTLVYFHPRGEEIKVWWNKHVGGTGEEAGVINPAIM